NVSRDFRGFHQMESLVHFTVNSKDFADVRLDHLRQVIPVSLFEIDWVDPVRQDFQDCIDCPLIDTLVLADDQPEPHAVKRSRSIPPVGGKERNTLKFIVTYVDDLLAIQYDDLPLRIPVL